MNACLSDHRYMECGYTIYIAIYHGIFTLVSCKVQIHRHVNGYIGSVRRGFVVNLQLFLKASVCVDGIYLDRIGVDSCGEYWKLCCICTSQVKGT